MKDLDIPYLLTSNVDLNYLVFKQDESNLGKALTQLKALKALRKIMNDSATAAISVPLSIEHAINTLIIQRSQLILKELSSMSLVTISDEDIVVINQLLTS